MARPNTGIRTVIAGLLLAAIAAGCDSSDPLQPSMDSVLFSHEGTEETVTMLTDHVDRELFNPCTGEWVHAVGPARVLLRQRSDGAGGFIVGMTRDISGVKGTGLSSGLEYQLVGTHTFQAHVRPPFPITLNEQFRQRMVPPGDLPVALLNGWDRFTVDANGQIRVDVLVGGHITCRGP